MNICKWFLPYFGMFGCVSHVGFVCTAFFSVGIVSKSLIILDDPNCGWNISVFLFQPHTKM